MNLFTISMSLGIYCTRRLDGTAAVWWWLPHSHSIFTFCVSLLAKLGSKNDSYVVLCKQCTRTRLFNNNFIYTKIHIIFCRRKKIVFVAFVLLNYYLLDFKYRLFLCVLCVSLVIFMTSQLLLFISIDRIAWAAPHAFHHWPIRILNNIMIHVRSFDCLSSSFHANVIELSKPATKENHLQRLLLIGEMTKKKTFFRDSMKTRSDSDDRVAHVRPISAILSAKWISFKSSEITNWMAARLSVCVHQKTGNMQVNHKIVDVRK